MFFDLVRIDSESGEEAETIRYVARLCKEALNAECLIDTYGNLIAKVPAKGCDRSESILLGAHADTVSPGKGIEPILEAGVIRSKGNTILGADNKAGIAEILEALRSADSHPSVEFVVTREEEVGHLGAKHLDISMIRSKKGFVFDSANLDTIIVGGPSNMFIDIKITGKAAHAGMQPEKGISAIKAASYAIAMLKEGWVNTDTTVNIGTINGGEVRNSVPEKVDIKAQCRSLTHQRCLDQSEVVRKVFETAALSVGADAKVHLNLAYKAMQVPEDAAVVNLAKAAIAAIGVDPKLRVITGGSDASEYNEMGIQTVVLGTGARSEHTVDEHIYVEDMEKTVRLLKGIFHAAIS
jgi:tripeptide aminopeptidase